MSQPAVLALEDGTIFRGLSIGASGTTVGEVVFNTAMTGYQEILTDPSYCRQIVTLTYPHIGNTGVTKEDEESTGIQAAGLIIRDLPLLASNFRSEQSLSDYLAGGNTVAIADIDTRKLTRILRDGGAQSGCIMAGAEVDETQALEQARAFAGLKGMDLAKVVTTSEPYEWTEGAWQLPATAPDASDRRAPALSVVALDFGVKRNILRILVDLGCTVTVMPAQSTIDEVMAHAPDGVFFSNGPGDPEPCEYAITLAREVMDRIGITSQFAAVYDIGDANYVPKPAIDSYRRLCELHNIDPTRAAMVEDIPRNLEPAAELGMTTVWVRTETSWAKDVTETGHIDHITGDLTAWLQNLKNSS